MINTITVWMVTEGTPISGNLHLPGAERREWMGMREWDYHC